MPAIVIASFGVSEGNDDGSVGDAAKVVPVKVISVAPVQPQTNK